MKTGIFKDAFGQPILVSLENVLAVRFGGGVYDSSNTNVFVSYMFTEATVQWQIKEVDRDKVLEEIQKGIEAL